MVKILIYRQHRITSANVNIDDQLLPCVCGRRFKGRRGLRRHQCTCKIKKLLDDESTQLIKLAEQLESQESGPNDSEDPIQRNEEIPDNPGGDVDDDIPVILPGVHLPRNPRDWEEANTFFNIAFMDALHSPIRNLDEFTRTFQKSIYDYFAENYGTVKKDDDDYENLERMSVKDLKRKLCGLKKHPEKGEEIHIVSKLIRNKLKCKNTGGSETKDSKSENISNQLRKHFWKTCEKLFKPAENIRPKFSLELCTGYFKSILSKLSNRKFSISPSWILQLPDPIHPFDTSPPSYKELCKTISKAKSRSSSCSFDQINYIMLKRCLILRTILLKIIVECWKTSSIPNCWKRGLSILIYKTIHQLLLLLRARWDRSWRG